jgi:hypothetical protein
MKTSLKIAFLAFFLCSNVLYSFADRGLRKKGKSSRVNLNINTTGGFSTSLPGNLKNGLKLKSFTPIPSNGNPSMHQGIKTYQKGNTLYLVPQRAQILRPDFKQGYGGVKLVLQTKF